MDIDHHEATNHTRESVGLSRFLDWNTQPSSIKQYPPFLQRIPFSQLPFPEFWPLIGSVSQENRYGKNAKALRTVPSAGGLYPTELYVQIRDMHPLINGIYHYSVAESSLVFIHPLARDGLEHYLGIDRYSGLLFIVTSAWFRSYWKYQQRSLRYLLLDGGHMLGALEAAASVIEKEITFQRGFPVKPLSDAMGLGSGPMTTELILAAGMIEMKTEMRTETQNDQPVKPLRLQLPFVLPTDYHEGSPELIEAYTKTYTEKTSLCKTKPEIYQSALFDTMPPFNQTIIQRRSARGFEKKGITENELQVLFDLTDNPKQNHPLFENSAIEVYAIVHNHQKTGSENNIEPGVYKSGKLLSPGDFSEQTTHLCLDQKLGGEGAALFIITGSSEDYQADMLSAGLLAHRIYLKGTQIGLSVSGIGAFYDNEVREFLNTPDRILYAVAAGR